MFKGYSQHDSSELITFLLDGLHEDLNRVRQKPYVEMGDSENRQDFDVAKEAWEGFTKRNRSVIVDMMYGQYKSKLQCPTCSRISITFDPFSMVSLGVPNTKKKYLNFSVQTSFCKYEKKREAFTKNSVELVETFLQRIS
jgi:ubiquitin carboxyl-terminal hydrolase 4/11